MARPAHRIKAQTTLSMLNTGQQLIIPREPLTFGSRYRVQVEADGRFIDWTFGVEQLSN